MFLNAAKRSGSFSLWILVSAVSQTLYIIHLTFLSSGTAERKPIKTGEQSAFMALNIVTGVGFVPFIVQPLRSLMMGYVIVRMWRSGSTLQDAGDRSAGVIGLIIMAWETNVTALLVCIWTCPASQSRLLVCYPCLLMCVFVCIYTYSIHTSLRGMPTNFRSCCSDGSDTRTGPSWATRRWPWDLSTWLRYHDNS